MALEKSVGIRKALSPAGSLCFGNEAVELWHFAAVLMTYVDLSRNLSLASFTVGNTIEKNIDKGVQLPDGAFCTWYTTSMCLNAGW